MDEKASWRYLHLSLGQWQLGLWQWWGETKRNEAGGDLQGWPPPDLALRHPGR